MKRPSRSTTPTSSEEDSNERVILDSDEQDEVVNTIKLEATKQNDKIRLAFTIVFASIMLIFAIMAIITSMSLFGDSKTPPPFAHQVLLHSVSLTNFMVYYLSVIITIAVSSLITWSGKSSLSKGVLIAITILSIMISVAWGVVFWDLKVTNIALYWLPAAGPFCLFLSLYVDNDISGFAKEINYLDGLKYESIKTA